MKNSPHPSTSDDPPKKERSVINNLIVGAVGVISAVYLFNPTAGFLELIPDNIPVVGNLDEAAAAAMLISALAYFGIDIGRLFGRSSASPARKEKKNGNTIDAEFVER
ncbi:MAG: DUF1232 domain-containing protein [Verrucomicrobiae bacterium]|nr:DUF1232 domain-containing protein [Verrucomicrobiae bacterium]